MTLDSSLLDPFLRNDEAYKSLDLSFHNLSPDDLALISQIIAKNPYITKLCLSDNRFSKESIYQLAVGLRKNKGLKVLEFNNCGLDCEDLKVLADALAVNQSVISLSLASNNIAYTGIKHLIQLQSLEILNISQNAKIGPGAAKLIKYFKNLLSLDISNNTLNQIALISLARSNRLMRLNIRNTGNYTKIFDLGFFKINYSIISLDRTLTGDERDENYIEFISGNRNAMLKRYNDYINIVTRFACHFVSYACQSVMLPDVKKQAELWDLLPRDLQTTILKFAALTDKLHIGLNSLQIVERISSVYQSTFRVVEQRKRRNFIESATHVTTNNIERWKSIDLKSLNIFDLFSGNEEYAIPDLFAPLPEGSLIESLPPNVPNPERIPLDTSTLPLMPPVPETMRERSSITVATSLAPLSSVYKLSQENIDIPVAAWSDGDVNDDSDKDFHNDVNPNVADEMNEALFDKENQAADLKRTTSLTYSFWQSPSHKKSRLEDKTPVTTPEKDSPSPRLR